MKLELTFVVFFSFVISVRASKIVQCESVEYFRMMPDWDEEESCLMANLTVISSPGVTISETVDNSIPGLNFDGNKNIKYLPSQIFKTLPQLTMLSAYSCSIKSISKESFENLSSLRCLWLSGNRITKVSSDTFDGLKLLELLDLSKTILFPFDCSLRFDSFRFELHKISERSNVRTVL